MKLKETDLGLEIKHTPGCLWVFGCFFFVVGSIFLYGLLGGFSNYDKIETWEIAVGLVISLSIIVVGIWQILSHPVMITTINGRNKTITLVEKGFIRRQKRELKFSEVSKFEIVEEKDSEGDSFYYIVLKTKRSEKIKLSSSGIQVESYVLEIKDEINRYLEKEKLLER